MKSRRLAWVGMGVLIGCVLTFGVVKVSKQPPVASWLANQSWASSPWVASVTEPGLTEAENKKFAAVMRVVEERYVNKVMRKPLMDGALEGFVAALDDPYSEYLDAKEVQSFNEHVTSTFSGIGAELALKDKQVIVLSPIRNSPAERAGLKPGDIILSVNGIALQGLELTEAVGHIRGPKGTVAKLIIRRTGASKTLEVNVVRDDIRLETVESERLAGDIGWIRISQFATNTGERFAEELTKLEKTKLRGLIIDVRNNPGGVVQAVETISELLVPKDKMIVNLEYRDGQREKTTSSGKGKPYPLVVLMNEGSASASEILAAAIKESANGTLVGKKTFGKGLVQTTVQLPDQTAVKLTIAKWLTPKGTVIHKAGIKPDIDVSQTVLFEALAIPKEKVWKFDMVGDEVQNLQRILQGLGYKIQRTDGYFDRTTQAAVQAFQVRYKLPANGEVTKDTATKLEQVVIEAYTDPQKDAQLNAAINYLMGR
jgi:carboxyl-terminal processing protease